jgi:hypothetical protein
MQDSILRLVGLALRMPRGDTFLLCMSPAFPAQSNKIKHIEIIDITVSWDVTPCSLVDRYQCFDPKDGGGRFYQTIRCHTLKTTSNLTLSFRWEATQFIPINNTAFWRSTLPPSLWSKWWYLFTRLYGVTSQETVILIF